MKIVVLALALLASAIPALTQNLITPAAPSGVWVLYCEPLTVCQYDIGFAPGAWKAHQESDVYDWQPNPNFFQLITVMGTTEIHASTNQNACASGCSYVGVFPNSPTAMGCIEGTGLFEQLVAWPDGSVSMRVSGTACGTFTDPNGIVYENINARLFFETVPTANPDWNSPVGFAPGEFIVELQPVPSD
jgi:hypothetical protein